MTRIRFSFARKEPLRYISHLDTVRLFHRALRRSGLSPAYSRGFNPHPRFNLALPLPLGVTADEEFGEVYFEEKIEPGQFVSALNPQLPAGLELTGAFIAAMESPALPALIRAALYKAAPATGFETAVKPEEIRTVMEKIMARDKIMAPRPGKKKKKIYTDVRPFILNLDLYTYRDRPLEIKMLLQAGSKGGVSPGFILRQLEQDLDNGLPPGAFWLLHRERLYLEDDGTLQPLSEGM